MKIVVNLKIVFIKSWITFFKFLFFIPFQYCTGFILVRHFDRCLFGSISFVEGKNVLKNDSKTKYWTNWLLNCAESGLSSGSSSAITPISILISSKLMRTRWMERRPILHAANPVCSTQIVNSTFTIQQLQLALWRMQREFKKSKRAVLTFVEWWITVAIIRFVIGD